MPGRPLGHRLYHPLVKEVVHQPSAAVHSPRMNRR